MATSFCRFLLLKVPLHLLSLRIVGRRKHNGQLLLVMTMGLLRVLLGLGLLLLLLQKEALKKKTSPLLIIKSISRSTAIVSHRVLLQEERLECCSMINKFKVFCVFSCAFCVYFYLLECFQSWRSTFVV